MSDVNLPARLLGDEPEFADELEVAFKAETELPAVAAHWRISGVETAEWAMAKLAEVELARAAVERQYLVFKAKIDAYRVDALRGLDRRADYFTGQLQMWGITERQAHPKEATLYLPSGRVATTKHKETEPKVVVADEGALIEWLIAQVAEGNMDGDEFNAVVRTERHAKIGELRTRVVTQGNRIAWMTTGEAVPGLAVEPGKSERITASVEPEL